MRRKLLYAAYRLCFNELAKDISGSLANETPTGLETGTYDVTIAVD